MNLPDRIDVVISLNGKPVANHLVEVVIKVNRKNNFATFAGPSNSSGQVSIQRDEMLRRFESDINLFPMDYAHPESAFTGQIEISPVGAAQLAAAISAFQTFRGATPYPSGWEKM